LALALAGEEKRARSTAENALAIASSLNDPFTMALTLYFASATAQVLGDVTLAAHTRKPAGAWRQSMTLRRREHGARGSLDGALPKAATPSAASDC
jgi:hypothetical protein